MSSKGDKKTATYLITKTPFWQLSTKSRNCWCYAILVAATCSEILLCGAMGAIHLGLIPHLGGEFFLIHPRWRPLTVTFTLGQYYSALPHPNT